MKIFFLVCTLLIVTISCNNKTKTYQKKTSKSYKVAFEELPADFFKIKKHFVKKTNSNKTYITNTTPLFSSDTIKEELAKRYRTTPVKLIPGSKDFKILHTKNVTPISVIAKKPEAFSASEPTPFVSNSLGGFQFNDVEIFNSNVVYCSVFDTLGNLWLGTQKGLIQFNGKNYYKYTIKQGLLANKIIKLQCDLHGNIWILTDFGISKFDGTKFYHFKQVGKYCNNLYIDKNGIIWVCTEDKLLKLDGDNYTEYRITHQVKYENSTYESHEIYSVYMDSKNKLWIGMYGHIGYFDGVTFFDYTPINTGYEYIIENITEDKNGNIYFQKTGTGWDPVNDILIGSGLLKFNGYNILECKPKWRVEFERINSIKIDSKNRILLGGKLFEIINNKLSNIYHNNINIDKNLKFTVISILEDNQQNYWLTTTENGLFCIKSNFFTHYNIENGLKSSKIFNICQDKKGHIWLGGEANLVSLKDNWINEYDLNTYVNSAVRISTDTTNKISFSEKSYEYKTIHDKNIERHNEISDFAYGSTLSYYIDNFNKHWITSYDFIKCFDNDSVTEYNSNTHIKSISSIAHDKLETYYFASDTGLLKFCKNKFSLLTEKQGLISNNINCITFDKNQHLWVGTDRGISIIKSNTLFEITTLNGLIDNDVKSILFDKNGSVWIGTSKGLSFLKIKSNQTDFNFTAHDFKNYNIYDGFIGNSCLPNSIIEDHNGYIWVGTHKMLTCINPKNDIVTIPKIQLTGIDIFNEKIDWGALTHNRDTIINTENGFTIHDLKYKNVLPWHQIPIDLILPYDNNNISFHFIGVNESNANQVQYSYILEGIEKKWNKETTTNYVKFENLPPNSYTFKVKAKNKNGIWSTPLVYRFKIEPPWWKTWWFILILGVLFLCIIILYIKHREYKFKKQQIELENIVKERTAEIVLKNKLIIEKQKEIIDSINYAKRIQFTLLAHSDFLNQNIPNNFVYFNPKDIVSGDFYWAAKRNNKFYLAVCDSTGHGVPGAFMSLLNIGFLSEAINEKGIEKPNEVFNFVRNRLIENISKEGQKDGFDGILICIDNTTQQITYAAANNRPNLIHNNTLIELETDRMPVGLSERKMDFKLHTIDAKQGDTLYLYTDGYPDQFGGPLGKKFKYKQLQQLILSNNSKSLFEIQNLLNETFHTWKGDSDQVDDVCIIGLII